MFKRKKRKNTGAKLLGAVLAAVVVVTAAVLVSVTPPQELKQATAALAGDDPGDGFYNFSQESDCILAKAEWIENVGAPGGTCSWANNAEETWLYWPGVIDGPNVTLEGKAVGQDKWNVHFFPNFAPSGTPTLEILGDNATINWVMVEQHSYTGNYEVGILASNVSNLTLDHLSLVQSSWDGVVLSGVQNATITNSNVGTSEYHGLKISNSDDVSISNSFLSGNDKNLPGAPGVALFAEADVTNLSVNNSVFRNNKYHVVAPAIVWDPEQVSYSNHLSVDNASDLLPGTVYPTNDNRAWHLSAAGGDCEAFGATWNAPVCLATDPTVLIDIVYFDDNNVSLDGGNLLTIAPVKWDWTDHGIKADGKTDIGIRNLAIDGTYFSGLGAHSIYLNNGTTAEVSHVELYGSGLWPALNIYNGSYANVEYLNCHDNLTCAGVTRSSATFDHTTATNNGIAIGVSGSDGVSITNLNSTGSYTVEGQTLSIGVYANDSDNPTPLETTNLYLDDNYICEGDPAALMYASVYVEETPGTTWGNVFHPAMETEPIATNIVDKVIINGDEEAVLAGKTFSCSAIELTDCGTTITTQGDYYLREDLVCSAGEIGVTFALGSEGSTFDLGRYKITGGDVAVEVAEDNITLMNGTFEGNDKGVVLYNATDTIIKESIIDKVRYEGANDLTFFSNVLKGGFYKDLGATLAGTYCSDDGGIDKAGYVIFDKTDPYEAPVNAGDCNDWDGDGIYDGLYQSLDKQLVINAFFEKMGPGDAWYNNNSFASTIVRRASELQIELGPNSLLMDAISNPYNPTKTTIEVGHASLPIKEGSGIATGSWNPNFARMVRWPGYVDTGASFSIDAAVLSYADGYGLNFVARDGDPGQGPAQLSILSGMKLTSEIPTGGAIFCDDGNESRVVTSFASGCKSLVWQNQFGENITQMEAWGGSADEEFVAADYIGDDVTVEFPANTFIVDESAVTSYVNMYAAPGTAEVTMGVNVENGKVILTIEEPLIPTDDLSTGYPPNMYIGLVVDRPGDRIFNGTPSDPWNIFTTGMPMTPYGQSDSFATEADNSSYNDTNIYVLTTDTDQGARLAIEEDAYVHPEDGWGIGGMGFAISQVGGSLEYSNGIIANYLEGPLGTEAINALNQLNSEELYPGPGFFGILYFDGDGHNPDESSPGFKILDSTVTNAGLFTAVWGAATTIARNEAFITRIDDQRKNWINQILLEVWPEYLAEGGAPAYTDRFDYPIGMLVGCGSLNTETITDPLGNSQNSNVDTWDNDNCGGAHINHNLLTTNGAGLGAGIYQENKGHDNGLYFTNNDFLIADDSNPDHEGFMQCVAAAVPHITELVGVDENVQENYMLGAYTHVAPANMPFMQFKDNTCGSNPPSGGFSFYMPNGIWEITGNMVIDPQYVGFAISLGGVETYENIISQYGSASFGEDGGAFILMDGNTVVNPGTWIDSIVDLMVGESPAGNDGILADAFGEGILIGYGSNTNPNLNTLIVIINNTLPGIGATVAGANPDPDYWNTVTTIMEGNTNELGEPTLFEIYNDATVFADAIAALLDSIITDVGTLDWRCGIRGGSNTHCSLETRLALYEEPCAVALGNDPELVTRPVAEGGCPVKAQSTASTIENNFAHGTIYAQNNHYFGVVTDSALSDPMGFAVNSVSKDVIIGQGSDFRNFIIQNAPDGDYQGMSGKKKEGSVLWVHEPTEVVWVNETEYYPFFFESDSDWTVDVCMEVPEGYVIVEGEECVQAFVANEEKTVNFTVQEVGSVPGNSKIKYKFRGPDGKLIKEESEVGVRLHPSLYKQKKGEGELGDYEIDEKGRLKKIN